LANKLKKKNKAVLNLLEEYGYKIDNGINTGKSYNNINLHTSSFPLIIRKCI